MLQKRFYLLLYIQIILFAGLFYVLISTPITNNELFKSIGLLIALIIIAITLYKHLHKSESIIDFLYDQLLTGNYALKPPPKLYKWLHKPNLKKWEELSQQLEKSIIKTQQQAQLTQVIIDNIPIAILSIAQSGEVTFSNQTLRHILRLDKPATRGAIEALWPQLAHLIAQQTPSNTTLTHVTKQYRAQYAVRTSLIRIAHARIRIFTLQNISRELSDQELASWQQLLRTLTHEINNSVSPILSLIQAAQDEYMPRLKTANTINTKKTLLALEQSLSLIGDRSKKLKTFVENYRKLTPKQPVAKQCLNISEVLYKMRILFSSQIHEYKIEWREDLAENALEINADPAYLEQLLINIIKNSIESMQNTGGILHIYSHKFRNAGLTITIKDTGEGIAEAMKAQIFTPFFTTKTGGSGIGLTLCRQLMHMHGGTLTVTSEEQRGSVVTMLFP